MGAGKSTIGRLLAARLHVRFHDLDEMIVEKAGSSIPEIFARQGEAVFRGLESEVLQSASKYGPAVVATGGGIVLDADNRLMLQSSGHVVWLDAQPDVLAERVRGDGNRPLMQGVDPLQKAQELDLQRRSLYRSLAHIHIDTASVTAQQAVDVICAFLSESAHE
jgi:shikimate kinase